MFLSAPNRISQTANDSKPQKPNRKNLAANSCNKSFKSKACENFCPLQGSFGPFGPKVAKRVWNEFPGPGGSGGFQKSKTESKKNQDSLKIVDFDLFSTWFWTFVGKENPSRDVIEGREILSQIF